MSQIFASCRFFAASGLEGVTTCYATVTTGGGYVKMAEKRMGNGLYNLIPPISRGPPTRNILLRRPKVNNKE